MTNVRLDAWKRVRLCVYVGFTALLVLTGCEKGRLDDEVRRLCAIDGGVKVYETVDVPEQRRDVAKPVPLKSHAKAFDEYFYEWDLIYLRERSPQMWRNHFRLYRRADGKLLGESISYGRRGGDLPGPLHESSFLCPNDADISHVEALVFKRHTREAFR